MKTFRRTFIDGRYGQMHARIAIPEKQIHTPLYCIHQSPSSSVIYIPMLNTLGRDRIVVAGDTPGFGESDQPPGPPTIADYAAAHGDVVDAMGLEGPIDVMGYYTGSKIAVDLALQRPQQVRRVVLFGAVVYTDEELAGEKRLYERDVYDWDASHLMEWWDHLKRGAPTPYPIDLFMRHFAEILRGGPDSWWGHRAAFDYDLKTALSRLTQPVLVLRTADPQGDKTLRAMSYLRDGRLVELPYMGQGLLDLHADEVNAHLRAFLDA